MNKKIICCTFSLLIIFSLMASVLAITAKIGNPKMVLRPEVGDTIERSIRVINDNDIAVTINLFSSGDLANDTKIQDEEFRLEPGEEKKAYFTIYIKNPGKTQTYIHTRFAPVDGTSGAGFSSSIVIITEDGISDEDDEDDEDDFVDEEYIVGDDEDDLIEDDEDDNSEGSILTGDVIGGDKNKISNIKIGLLVTSGIFLLFLASLVVLFKKTKEGIELEGNEKSEKKIKKSVAGKSKKKVQKK